jgi:hypothetical protein
LNIFVPKKRGEGFLQQPYGHHVIKGLSEIEDKLGVDFCGLDGCLEVDAREYSTYEKTRKEFEAKIFPMLLAHYDYVAGYREAVGIEDIVLHPSLSQAVKDEEIKRNPRAYQKVLDRQKINT